MSFGYSVGDFVAIGALAWTLYKDCKSAPESFSNISQEVLSMHAVMNEAKETLFARPLPPEGHVRLKEVVDGCQRVLKDLEALVTKYASLGTQTKRTWHRMRWHSNDINELRLRLISNTGLLSAFISTSQLQVEKKLDEFIKEFREGKHEGSILSGQTIESVSPDEKQLWITFRNELEDIGISVAAFDANRDFIIKWFAEAANNGSFEESLPDRGSNDFGDSTANALDPRNIDISSSTRDSAQERSLKDGEEDRIEELRLRRSRKHSAKQNAQVTEGQGALESAERSSLPQLFPTTLSPALPLQSSQDKQTQHRLRLEEEMRALRLVPTRQRDAVNVELPFDRMSHREFWTSPQKDANMQLLQRCLGSEANVEAKFPVEEADGIKFLGWRAIHFAAGSGSAMGISILLDNGAHIEARTARATTPLIIASKHGHVEAINVLLNSGADLEAYNSGKQTAFHAALINRHLDATEFLLSNGCSLEVRYGDWTSRELALLNGWKDIATTLANRGVKKSVLSSPIRWLYSMQLRIERAL